MKILRFVTVTVLAGITNGLLVLSTPASCQIPLQKSEPVNQHIAQLRVQLKTETEQRARPERLAMLWMSLGHLHEGEGDYDSAEDAFARAINLLKASSDSESYVNALDALATVYLMKSQTDVAETYLRRALVSAQTLNDPKWEATVRKDLAVALSSRHKFGEAVTQASESLRLLQNEPNPDLMERITSYLARSRSLAGMRRYAEAGQDLQQARSLLQGKVAEDSLEVIALTAVEGSQQIQFGAIELGERTFRAALDLLARRTDLPIGRMRAARLRILENYSQSLKVAHVKRAARKVDEEIAMLKAQPERCPGCSISMAALGLAVQ